MREWPENDVSLMVLGGLLVLLQGPQLVRLVDKGIGPPVDAMMAEDAARALPADTRVLFNCEWHRTPYVMLARPDVSFIDILEPALLRRTQPRLDHAREALKKTLVPDAAAMMQDLFGADTSFCVEKSVVEQLDADPFFRRVFPPRDAFRLQGWRGPFIHQIIDEDAAFAHALLVSPVNFVPTPQFETTTPDTWTDRKPLELLRAGKPERFSRFLDFSQVPAAGKPSDGPAVSRCVSVQVPEKEIAAHVDAGLVGIGGGRSVRMWLNGEPLYHSSVVLAPAKLVQVLVPLPKTLEASDRLEAVVCSSRGAVPFGLAVSFWTERSLQDLCDRKNPGAVAAPVSPTSWPRRGTTVATCVAPIALAPSLQKAVVPEPTSK